MGLGKQYCDALRKTAKHNLDPMTKVIFAYHLKEFRKNEEKRKCQETQSK